VNINNYKHKWNVDPAIDDSSWERSIKKAVEKYPESYSSGIVRGRTKKIIYEGISFQGNWELSFYKWCKSNNIDIVRNEKRI
jgi:hypothetical protein